MITKGCLELKWVAPHTCGIYGGTRALVVGVGKSLIEVREACGKSLCDCMHLLLRHLILRGHVGEDFVVVGGCWWPLRSWWKCCG